MKILAVTPTYLAGGVGIYIKNIVSRLKQRSNLTLTILEYHVPKKYIWDIAQEEERIGKKLAYSYRDVDLVHSLVTYVAFLGKTIADELGVPHVASVHTVISEDYYIKHSLEGVGSMVKSKIIKFLIKSIESKIIESASKIITFSNMNKEKICSSFNVSDVEVIYHGSNHVLTVNYPSIREGVSSGIISEIKGYDILVKIAKHLPNLKFIITGESRLSSKSKHSFPPNIVYTGYIQDLVKLYELVASTKLYVLPSRYEAFSIATLEAMRLGVVPIVSENVGLKEILLRNNIKFVLPLNNIKLWINTINELYNEDLTKYSTKVVNIAKKYSWEASVDRHIEVYKSLGIS